MCEYVSVKNGREAERGESNVREEVQGRTQRQEIVRGTGIRNEINRNSLSNLADHQLPLFTRVGKSNSE